MRRECLRPRTRLGSLFSLFRLRSPLDVLPYELIPSILSLLPPRDLLLLKTTCHAFNHLIQSDALWREVYINRFVRSESDLGAEIPDYSIGGRRGETGRLLEWSEEDGRSSDGDVFGLARSCVTAGASGQGWQKEAIHREAMLEYVSVLSLEPCLMSTTDDSSTAAQRRSCITRTSISSTTFPSSTTPPQLHANPPPQLPPPNHHRQPKSSAPSIVRRIASRAVGRVVRQMSSRSG